MTPASFTLATVNKTVLKHKQPAHTQKLCVIKQLHNTQRVSMTTRKLLGSSRRSCHCTHACPSRVHCSNNEASSHLEQSNSPVVNCSGRAVHRGPAKHQTTECSKLTPLFGRRPHEAGIEPTSSKPTKLLTTFRLEATSGSRKSILNHPAAHHPGKV